MNMMKSFSLLALILLTGCSTAASRMAECESQGISRDTCYLSEQNRESANRAAILSASEAQAYKNQAEALQHAQAAKKERVYKGFGVTFKRHGENFAYLDDKLCAIDERTASAIVYSEGLYQVIAYKSGKVALMKNSQFVGYLK